MYVSESAALINNGMNQDDMPKKFRMCCHRYTASLFIDGIGISFSWRSRGGVINSRSGVHLQECSGDDLYLRSSAMDQKVKESVDNGLQNRHHHHPVVAWPPGADEGSLSSNESIIVGDPVYYNSTDVSLSSFQKLRGGATHFPDQSSSFSEDEEALDPAYDGSPVSYNNKWKKHLGYSSAHTNVSTNINDVTPDESSMHSEDYNSFHRVKLLCSYGGKILPRPTDKELRYVGGDTRLITVGRDIHFHELMQKMAELYVLACTIKYKLPEEDLDALVSVSSNEDVANMMEEYDRLQSSNASPRLRLFLFSDTDHESVLHPNESFGDHRSSTEQQRYVYAVNGISESGPKKYLGDGGSLAIAPVVIDNSLNDVVGEPWGGLIRQQDTIPVAMLAPQISQDVASLIHHVPVALPVSSIPPTTSAPSSPPLIPRVMKQGDGDSLHQEPVARDDARRLPEEVRIPRVLSHGKLTRLLDHHSEASAPLVRQRHNYQQPQPSQQHGGWQPNLYEEETHVSLQLPHIRSPFLTAPIFDQPVYRPVDHLSQGEEVFAPFMQRSISVNTMPGPLGSTAVTSFNAAAVSAPSSPRTNHKRDPLLSIHTSGQPHLQQQMLRSHAAAPNYAEHGLRHHAARSDSATRLGPVTSPPRYRDHHGLGFGQTDERLLRPLQQPVLATTDGLQLELFLYDGHRSAYGQYSEGAVAKVSLPQSLGYNPFLESPSSFSEPNPGSETQDCGDGRRYGENVSLKLFHPLHFNARDDDLQDDSSVSSAEPRSIQARYQEKPMNRVVHDQRGKYEEVHEGGTVADVNAAGGRFQIHLPEDSEDLLVVSKSYCPRNTDMGEPSLSTNNQQYRSTGIQSHMMSLYPSTHRQASVVDMPQVPPHVGLESERGFPPRSVTGILELGSTPALGEVGLPSEILSSKSLSLTNMADKAAIGSFNNFVPHLSSASSRVGNNTESVVNIAELRWGESNDVIESRINLQARDSSSSTILDQFQRLSGSGVAQDRQSESSVGTRIEASEELALQQRSHDNSTIIPLGDDDSMVEEKTNSVAYDLHNPILNDDMTTPIIPQLSISEGQAQALQPMTTKATAIDDAQTHTLNATAKSEEFGLQPPIEVEEKLRSSEDLVPEALVSIHVDLEQGSSNPGSAEDAEAEAIRSGLQTILNAHLEEMRELGSGTFGTVYHGKWRGTDVAIKRIKSSCFAGRPAERDRLIADFWREACTLSQLHHPNVVAFYGVVRDSPGGKLATVTEYMVNGSLKQVLQKKDRTIDRRKRLLIAMDAAFGMEYLHSKNIVHFDLKCDNLLVNMRDSHRPICKVGDLGLSKVKHQTMVSGGVRGTLPWMAPELLNGSSTLVTEKVDVFSFGIVMWELLTGEEPYASMHYGAIIGGIVNNTLRPSIPSWCDPLWKSLMEKCWSAEPTCRPSFSEVANELRVMATPLQPKAHVAQ